jgi:hypothetical protein
MSLDLDVIFPIRDLPSAGLMMLKASCLWNAGIISDRQRELVHSRAERFAARGVRRVLLHGGRSERKCQ